MALEKDLEMGCMDHNNLKYFWMDQGKTRFILRDVKPFQNDILGIAINQML